MKEYVTAVILRGDKFLTLFHLGINRWVFPGGKPEGDEDLAIALHRELKEEIGVEPVMTKFVTSVIHDVKGEEWTGWFLRAWLPSGAEPVLQEPDQHGDMQWLTLEQMRDLCDRGLMSDKELLIAEEVWKG